MDEAEVKKTLVMIVTPQSVPLNIKGTKITPRLAITHKDCIILLKTLRTKLIDTNIEIDQRAQLLLDLADSLLTHQVLDQMAPKER
jgi:hypothetical protein